jgi:hypothetical protein
LRVLLPFY